MNAIEKFFLDFGFSWSASKAIPYVFCILLGIVLVFVYRRFKPKNVWIFRSVAFVLLTLPFSVYFSIYPIYEGDFSNQGTKPTSSIQFPANKALTVVVLPNCPYCYQSIALMKKIKKRNPLIPISYWVVSADTLPAKSAILKVIPKEFQIEQRHDIAKISELVQGSFPCFILSDRKSTVKSWNNNQFGVRALDEIETFFK